MSTWFENFMVESLEPVHDAIDVFDFMWFGGDDIERTDAEFRRVAKVALANLDNLLQAGFKEWEMNTSDTFEEVPVGTVLKFEEVSAETAINRWREQLDRALETDDFNAMLEDLRWNGPFLLARLHHPRRPSK